jgi:hypothetical protein
MTLRALRLLSGVTLLAGTASVQDPAVRAQTRTPRTALAIHWSTEDYPVNPVTNEAVREGLLAGPDAAIDYHAEYLESDRFPAEEAALALRDYIRHKGTVSRRADRVPRNLDGE